MTEHWRCVVGYEGLYEVSNLGAVRSIKRRTTKGGILRQCMGLHYLMVHLSKGGKTKTHCVHRLVAEAWIPNPLMLPQVNHKYGIKTDNRVTELEWCSVRDNQLHRFNTLKHTPKSRSLDDDVIKILETIPYRGYRRDLAKRFNTSISVIESVRGGRNYKRVTKQT